MVQQRGFSQFHGPWVQSSQDGANSFAPFAKEVYEGTSYGGYKQIQQLETNHAIVLF